jgi:DNA-directed RNA polymerase subunit omega
VSNSKIIDFEAGKAAADKATAAGSTASTAWKPGTGTETTMRSDLVEQASEIIPEAPLLINMISRRVKQLNMGRTPLVTPEPRMGMADIALLEIIEGKVVVDDGEDDAGK